MVDYVGLAATAERLIADAGRTITFVRMERNPVDSAKPWRSASTPANDSTSSITGKAENRLDAVAVMVEPSSATKLGLSSMKAEEATRSEKIFIVARNAVDVDLDTYDTIVDSAVVWRIQFVEELKPGETSLLYFVGVRK
jgi:hypothetical protein